MVETPPVVLTIAGFDPSSGAGITADIKTIAANGCYGIAGITALTVQSSSGVKRVVPADLVLADSGLLRETLEELAGDIEISAVHVGMLGSGQIATCVADFLAGAKLPYLVLDPILKSSSGASLLDESGINVLKKRLLPLATVVTPNVDEAAALTGIEVLDLEGMERAARRLHEMGAGAVVVTGGHLDQAVDLLSARGEQKVFRADRVASKHTHGTGCAFSTAMACHLAWGRPLSTAVLLAKAYVTSAIRHGYAVGKGAGPVNNMFQKRSLRNGEERGEKA